MPGELFHPEAVQSLLDAGAQLVEVLPEAEFLDQHLPGALHLPLRRIEREAADLLDRTRPIVVYCWDSV